MKSISTNPFLITGYQGPDYFCDREKETASLMSALKNGRNITLISPRRMGKTGYIFNPESSGVCISTGTKCVGEIRYLITEYLKIAILIL